jgi:hypothetical protein
MPAIVTAELSRLRGGADDRHDVRLDAKSAIEQGRRLAVNA